MYIGGVCSQFLCDILPEHVSNALLLFFCDLAPAHPNENVLSSSQQFDFFSHPNGRVELVPQMCRVESLALAPRSHIISGKVSKGPSASVKSSAAAHAETSRSSLKF